MGPGRLWPQESGAQERLLGWLLPVTVTAPPAVLHRTLASLCMTSLRTALVLLTGKGCSLSPSSCDAVRQPPSCT